MLRCFGLPIHLPWEKTDKFLQPDGSPRAVAIIAVMLCLSLSHAKGVEIESGAPPVSRQSLLGATSTGFHSDQLKEAS
jgi:hypothetical protein